MVYVVGMDNGQIPAKHHPLAVRLNARKDFVEGRGTLRQIALRHGLSFGTVRTWCDKEYWGRARQRWLGRQIEEPPSNGRTTAEKAEIPINTDAPTRTRKLETLDRQIEALDNLLDNASNAKDWQAYATAKSKLMQEWRILAGVPLPGSRRLRPESPGRKGTTAVSGPTFTPLDSNGAESVKP